MGASVVLSIRQGSGLTQKAAAEQIGFRPPTLAAYEAGRFVPSEAKVREIARKLALGKPARGEVDPTFLLTFWLFGRRLLADRAGRAVVFSDPWQVHRHAERLVELGFVQVAVTPVWRGKGRSMMRALGAPGQVAGEDLEDPLDALLQHTQELAAEFERMQGASGPLGEL